MYSVIQIILTGNGPFKLMFKILTRIVQSKKKWRKHRLQSIRSFDWYKLQKVGQ